MTPRRLLSGQGELPITVSTSPAAPLPPNTCAGDEIDTALSDCARDRHLP